MRLQANKPIKLREKILGGADPMICIPLVAEDVMELERAAKEVLELCPDAVEWRADYYKDACDAVKVKQALALLRRIIGEIPIIFTFRSYMEGGYKRAEDSVRLDVIKQAIYTKEADVVDIELISGKANIEEIKKAAGRYNVSLILSYHNFMETPSFEFLLDKIRKQVSSGADIAKIAVMPKTEEDVLTLLSVTLKARIEMADIPIITMSMGKLGVISRIAGGIFGSDLTFGANGKTSAPGQIPIDDLRNTMKILF